MTLEERLASALPSLLGSARIPGLGIALVEEGGLRWEAGFGHICAAERMAVVAGTIFQAASLSKPVFAYAVLGMVEHGAIDLDVPLPTYLPEPYVKDDPLLGEITARRVLCHTTGWPNWRPEGGQLERKWAPGERFGYSGEGYIYLQRVVEHLTHEPLDTYMRRAVFEPLAMKHSSYAWTAPGASGLAAAHDKEGRPTEPYIGSHPESSSSLHTTPGDFASFLCALLNPGVGQGCLRAETVAEMLRPQVHIEGALWWVLGWGLQTTGEGHMIWQWGDNPGYKSFALAVPSRRLGLVVMTNGDGGAALWEPFTRLVVGGEHPLFEWLMRTFYQTSQ